MTMLTAVFHSSHTPAVHCRAAPCVPSPTPSASSPEHHCYDVPVTSPSAAAAPVPYPAPFLETRMQPGFAGMGLLLGTHNA